MTPMSSAASARAAYTGNADAPSIAARLAEAANVVIMTHTKPDGDALGSCLGLARALARTKVASRVVLIPPVPDNLLALARPGEVEIGESALSQTRLKADLIAIVDTGSWSQLGPCAAFVRGKAEQALIVDHHVNGDPDMAATRFIDPVAPAASQMVVQIVMRLLKLPSAARLPVEIAEPIYLGLATDTGWFRHPSVLPSTMRLAADLIEAGVDQNALYQRSEQNDRPERIALAQRALASLRYVARGRAAIMTLTRADFEATGAQVDETGGLIEFPQAVGQVRVTALLYEPEPGQTRISMRSKAGDPHVDVNAIAQRFGGGGHTHAAGARMALPIVEAVTKLVPAIEAAFP